MYSIGWFSTAKGPGSRNLLKTVVKSIESGEIKAKIQFVFVSREPGESPETDKFIAMAESHRLPVCYLSSTRFRNQFKKNVKTSEGLDWRSAYDREIMRLLGEFPKTDINVLAGYMLIVSAEMCSAYDLINLHPAAPGGPTGTWQDVIWQLIDRGSTSSGVMMHLVTPELDKGPVISFCRYPIRHVGHIDDYWRTIECLSLKDIMTRYGEQNPLFREIRRHGMIRELPLMVSTIKALSEGAIRIENGLVYSQSGLLTGGYDLSKEIDRLVRTELDETI
ncbi:formyl transferase domain protein [Dehalogenimonas lykanthroporepellens BL-DC-9]|jgi:folate-dependent phosphoribosylglycinamide formyltransferase PurN|nr:formyl transferase domain protein [Dehalogenimonas lykanthroporepellens BL-DC-9]